MTEIQDRISIQVGLSGYSFKIESANGTESSGWLGAESIFTVSQMQKRYSDVHIAVFTPYCTLIPENFHKPELSKEMLSEVADLPQGAVVEYVPVPEYNAVMLYSNNLGGTLHKVVSESVLRTDGTKAQPLPELYSMLKSLNGIQEYNRIVASYMDGVLYLVIAQGKTYSAPDFTTAEYFIFLAMKKLQLNPEMSTINFRTPLADEQEMSLYRYFKSVDTI